MINFLKKRKNKSDKSDVFVYSTTPEYEDLEQIYDELNSILESNDFIAKSQYLSLINNVKNIEAYYSSLARDKALKGYCNQKNLDYKKLSKMLSFYSDYENNVNTHNEKYVQKGLKANKVFLDNILKSIDLNILLDTNQRDVILSDEDYTLVVAGAGAGKTTTVAAKVKYLVDKKNIDPKEILVISFTNKAVNELKERINDGLNIPCPITTFHKTGYAILRKEEDRRYEIVDADELYFILKDFFTDEVLKDEVQVRNIMMFFSYYLKDPKVTYDSKYILSDITKMDFYTMRSELENFKRTVINRRTNKRITNNCEKVRSNQELQIANFLYLNGIDYIYEPRYKYNIYNSTKPYTPDFLLKQNGKEVYLEHFGINQNGTSSRFDAPTLAFYIDAIKDKITIHKTHGTKLIYTFSGYNDGRSLLIHLEELLYKNGFVLSKRSEQETLHKLIKDEQSYYMKDFINLMTTFIHGFKTNNYGFEKFDEWITSTDNERDKIFLKLAKIAYRKYQNYLETNHMIDFEDMINKSSRLIDESIEVGSKLNFKYIIVDEYQDISRQRYDLVSSLSKLTKAKIIAVGDDFQSIYAFSGSDITLFTNFSEKFGYSDLKKIDKTYRNAQEIIDIAGGFIQENKAQIKKELISNKHIDKPMIIQTFDDSPKRYYKTKDKKNNKGSMMNMAEETLKALEHIIKFSEKEGKNPWKQKILFIGRFNFDINKLAKSGLFEVKKNKKIVCNKYPKLKIDFLTAHSSKGLGYDNVVIINCRNARFGFPSKIEDDTLLHYVIRDDISYEHAEERRLFYVAMTRTKNRVYFITPQNHPSEFLIELNKKYDNVTLIGKWDDQIGDSSDITLNCPICGFPLQARFKESIGLPLYICTNEPEVCGFMTNDLRGGKLSIQKCSSCDDGYLVVKPNRENKRFFLGCTNYTPDGKGCSRTISKETFYKQKGYSLDEVDYSSRYKNSRIRYSPSEKMCLQSNKKKPRIDDTSKEVSTSNKTKQEKVIKKTVTKEQKTNKGTATTYKYLTRKNIPGKKRKYISPDNKEVYSQLYTVMNTVYKLQKEIVNFDQNDLFVYLMGGVRRRINVPEVKKWYEYGELRHLTKEQLVRLIRFTEKKNWYIVYSQGTAKFIKITNEGIHFNKHVDHYELTELRKSM